MRPAPAIREHEGEPIPGLPERLPPGEAILWQGVPCWRALARHAFHMRGLALYFAVLAAWRAGILLTDGAGAAAVVQGVLLLVLLGAVPVAVVAGFAWLSARSALYTITNRRLVLRVGAALPTTVNIPFAAISDAGSRLRADGTGDLVLALLPRHRVSWLALWPHARPWRIGRPEPMLRCIPNAQGVGELLARALAADAGRPVLAAVPSPLPQQPTLVPPVRVPTAAAAA